MSTVPLLRVTGAVERPVELTFEDLCAFDPDQIVDVSQFDAKRSGHAIRLEAVLQHVGVGAEATHIGLHGTLDDFHASIPLDPVRNRGMFIFRQQGEPLTVKSGGPVRFFIADHAACHTDEIDECANVKFVDWVELTVGRGRDNRPADDEQHARLHESS